MKNLLLSTCCAILSVTAIAQPSVNELQYQRALKLKQERKDSDAFPIFQSLLKGDSSNVNYLQYTSYLYSRMGFRQPTEEAKQRYYKIAEYLAKKAIAADEKSAEAHYAYALALGRINENASSKQKIANAKLIKKEADRTIELNPKHGGAYHILGRWHRTIAGFSTIEKGMINSFYGGVPPGASYEKAVECFAKAVEMEGDYMLHKYELAFTYNEMGKEAYAKVWVQKAMQLPQLNNDDKETYKKCQDLLKDLD
ncbi:MAG: hypothetical protein FD123_1336 [Bacteroidetes bacterium]|nr:MAG: hypothetical protein FD123_1336 [Bacteroidota bacterium]